jgi:hypothetical protein
MSETDWSAVQHTYHVVDAYGNLEKDSIISKCEFDPYFNLMGCTFLVGTVDANEYGLSDGHQEKAGLQCAWRLRTR